MTLRGVNPLVYPLDRAIVAKIEHDATPGGLLSLLDMTNPVWSGVAPSGAVLDYIVLGDSQETEGAYRTFDGHSIANTLTIHVWTKDTSKRSASVILSRLKTLLHRQRLALTLDDDVTPLATLIGSLSIVTILPDPSGDVAHGVARYESDIVQPAGQ